MAHRLLRLLRYFIIGLAGGLLGIVLANVMFDAPAPPFWVAGLFAVLATLLGILRDRAIRRGRG